MPVSKEHSKCAKSSQCAVLARLAACAVLALQLQGKQHSTFPCVQHSNNVDYTRGVITTTLWGVIIKRAH